LISEYNIDTITSVPSALNIPADHFSCLTPEKKEFHDRPKQQPMMSSFEAEAVCYKINIPKNEVFEEEKNTRSTTWSFTTFSHATENKAKTLATSKRPKTETGTESTDGECNLTATSEGLIGHHARWIFYATEICKRTPSCHST
jgi:hypothetical protein